MNDRVLRILEFNKIIDMLAGEAGSDLSRERVRALRPLQGTEAVREALRETTEAVQIIDAKGPLPTEGLTDIRPSVDLAYKGVP